MKCVCNREVKVLRSGAGFFIGTEDDEGFINCRISSEYFPTKEDAQVHLNSGCFEIRSDSGEIDRCLESCRADSCFDNIRSGEEGCDDSDCEEQHCEDHFECNSTACDAYCGECANEGNCMMCENSGIDSYCDNCIYRNKS